MRKGKKAGMVLTAAAVAMAAILAFTLSYACARYVTGFYDITASVSGFDVSSEFTYTDAWGYGRSYGDDLGTMKRTDYYTDDYGKVVTEAIDIKFTMTVTNRGDVPVDVTLTIEGDGYKISSCGEGASVSDDKTLKFENPVPAAGTATVDFTVTTDEKSYVVGSEGDESSDTVTGTYSRELVFDVLYEQAKEA